MRTTRLPSDLTAHAWSVFAAATVHDAEPTAPAWTEEPVVVASPITIAEAAAEGRGDRRESGAIG